MRVWANESRFRTTPRTYQATITRKMQTCMSHVDLTISIRPRSFQSCGVDKRMISGVERGKMGPLDEAPQASLQKLKL
jgi:hypothetical protein